MLEVMPIRAFNDNYLWLFHPPGKTDACIVDPGDARPVLEALQEHKLNLEAIFITHHHADHIGGVDELLSHYKVPVYGPDSPDIPQVTHKLAQGDNVELFGHSFSVLEIPGHTLDHIAYFCGEKVVRDKPALFCGDTLFAGGCGRVFEGTHAMMYASLQKLAVLPGDTQVFCAHEYTLANLKFALAVNPDNELLVQRMAREKAKRSNDTPTVPTSIQLELETNPFMRCQNSELLSAAQQHAHQKLTGPARVFGVIRQWKDSF
ncbi:MAG: hydroxyacylglutathione hydrolase [Pseudohongiellaceae bacterium]